MENEQTGLRAAHSRSAWNARRQWRARQARTGTTVAVGCLLAFVGLTLGLLLAVKRDALLGAAIVTISAMFGLLFVLVGSLVDASWDAGGNAGSTSR